MNVNAQQNIDESWLPIEHFGKSEVVLPRLGPHDHHDEIGLTQLPITQVVTALGSEDDTFEL